MRKILFGLLLAPALLLANCTGTTPTDANVQQVLDKAKDIINLVKANCGAVVQVADIVAMVSADPIATTAATTATLVCNAIQKQTVVTAVGGERSGEVVVNGYTIRYTK